jgi:glycerol-3-phosphate dehydrogenase
VLGEAERFGAVFANGAEVVEVISDDGRAAGVVCVDAESGERFEVRADSVVNATGVWADRIRPEEILTEEEVPRIAPSRGTHVTISQDLLPVGEGACIVPAGEERTIFALPWFGRALVGTTDRDYEGDIARVKPSDEDIEYLLEAANAFFGTDIGSADLTGAYAGVRPLISTGDPRKSVDISRRAELYETSSGLLTITGGKLTTWRRMAKQVVDRMVEREGREAPCQTAEIPLGMPADDEDLTPPEGLADGDLPEGWRDLLAFRYGHAARRVLDLAAERPELACPIVPGQPDLLAEAAIAARLEQARTVADVLLRRTRLGLVAAPQLRTAESVTPVAEAMAGELGWDRRRTRREADGWPEVAAAEGIDPARA